MKGFTLIELLAVIVILAIILLISIPIIGNLIEGVKKEAFSSTSMGVIKAANQTYLRAKMEDKEGQIVFNINEGIITSEPAGYILEIDGKLPDNGSIKIDQNGKIQISVHDGKYCALKYANEEKVNISVQEKELCIIDETPPVINVTENGGEFYYLAISPTITDQSELETLSYAFSTSVTEPETGWFTFQKNDSINFSGVGTYYLHLRATDKPGNTRKFVSSAYTMLDPVTNFVYKGFFEEYTVKTTGTYKLEVWGAKGGGLYGGKGGYATGQINLTKNDKIFVYVGGQGKFTTGISLGGFNGGGNSGDRWSNHQGGGGGATDIRLTNNTLTDRIIVGAGGGGAGSNSGDDNATDYGGAAGGLTGGVGAINRGSGGPGTQVNAGIGGVYSGWTSGTGGNILVGGNGAQGGGGGGAGYYGGGGASWGGGGGGSSYYGTLSNSSTIDGNSTMPNPLGGDQTGNSGDGYARLTYLP